MSMHLERNLTVALRLTWSLVARLRGAAALVAIGSLSTFNPRVVGNSMNVAATSGK
jgi:hypothetical protein